MLFAMLLRSAYFQATLSYLYIVGGPQCGSWVSQLCCIILASFSAAIQNYGTAIMCLFVTGQITINAITMMMIKCEPIQIVQATVTLIGFSLVTLFSLHVIMHVHSNEKEKTMQKSLDNYRNLYRHAPVMFATVCGETLKITNYNGRFERTLKIEQDNKKELNLLDIFTPECQSHVKKLFKKSNWKSLKGFGGDFFTLNGEHLEIRVQNDTYHVSMSASIMESKSTSHMQFNVILHDMTQHELSQRKINQLNESYSKAKELAEKNAAAKGQFLAQNESLNYGHHSMQSLVVPILMLDQEQVRMEKNGKQLCKTINNSSKILSSLIDNILDFSKIEAGKLNLEYRPFSLRKCLDNVIEMLRMRALDQHSGLVDIQLEIKTKSLPDVIVGDELRLTQVVMNLISNAIKFQPSHLSKCSLILVSISSKLISTSPSKYLIDFEVTDSGIGIDLTQRDVLFSCFGQLDESTSRLYGGTGLGLSISKHIINSMDGEIWLERSELGKGSTFKFYCTFESATVCDGCEKMNSSSPPCNDFDDQEVDFGGLKILVAEDNKINRLVMGRMMKSIGLYDFDMVCDGEEALCAFYNKKYDLVVMDVRMPRLDGVQATLAIREFESKENKSRCPVLACTADVTSSQKTTCLQSGMDVVMSKPFNKDTLKAAINAAIISARRRI
ncbi:hybrid signal transduction histidine kinase K [Acrasis kona]|uniref:Hybrid signal transduction histidine kinase K n=1 Tax=Acrasis kona TaxID=1008807 RepID=A0AAW2YVG3_9EUKA